MLRMLHYRVLHGCVLATPNLTGLRVLHYRVSADERLGAVPSQATGWVPLQAVRANGGIIPRTLLVGVSGKQPVMKLPVSAVNEMRRIMRLLLQRLTWHLLSASSRTLSYKGSND